MANTNIEINVDTQEIEILLQAPVITRFIKMSDTPTTYVGSGLYLVRVNLAENALEFFHQSEDVLYTKSMTEAEIVAFIAPGKDFIVKNSTYGQLEWCNGLDRRILK